MSKAKTNAFPFKNVKTHMLFYSGIVDSRPTVSVYP